MVIIDKDSTSEGILDVHELSDKVDLLEDRIHTQRYTERLCHDLKSC